jgi:cation diffusion facilitator family transporter
MASKTNTVVYAALAGNVLVALTKAVAAAMTGSSAMLSEAIHSFVDTGNEGLLLYGMHRSRRKPDAAHPFGYGRELYFWSFIVALLIFAVGAGVSFYEGIVHLRNPEPMQRPGINYIVLCLSLLFEGGSWWVAVRTVRAAKGDQSYLQAITNSKDPPQFMVLLEDSAALIGILIALLATWASVTFHEPRFDGIGSLLIGGVLAAVAAFLAKESKDLLIGERADPVMQESVIAIAAAMPGVLCVNGLLTSQMSPTEVVAAMSLEFEDGLTITRVERLVAEMETAIRKAHPEITALFVKPQTPQLYKAAVARKKKGPKP